MGFLTGRSFATAAAVPLLPQECGECCAIYRSSYGSIHLFLTCNARKLHHRRTTRNWVMRMSITVRVRQGLVPRRSRLRSPPQRRAPRRQRILPLSPRCLHAMVQRIDFLQRRKWRWRRPDCYRQFVARMSRKGHGHDDNKTIAIANAGRPLFRRNRHVDNAKATASSIVACIMLRPIGPPVGSNAGRAILLHLYKALCPYYHSCHDDAVRIPLHGMRQDRRTTHCATQKRLSPAFVKS